MVTIMRIPIYLEIETGGTDRARVTKVLQEFVFPLMLKEIVSFGNDLHFTRENQRKMEELVGPFSMKVLSDVQAMAKKDI